MTLHCRNYMVKTPQSGFSMVELLVASFILSIGLLGLAGLQTMSMRTNADSTRVGLAVQISELKLEAIEGMARQRMLFLKYSNPFPSAAPTIFDGASETLFFDRDGTLQTSGGAPITAPTANTVYTLVTTSTLEQAVVANFGGMRSFRVSASFPESIDQKTGLPITRTITLTRRIMYA